MKKKIIAPIVIVGVVFLAIAIYFGVFIIKNLNESRAAATIDYDRVTKGYDFDLVPMNAEELENYTKNIYEEGIIR